MGETENGNTDSCGGVSDWDCSIKDNVSVEEGIRQVDSIRMQRGNDISPGSKILRTADAGGKTTDGKENYRPQLCR